MKRIDKLVATLLKKEGEKRGKESTIQSENVGDFTTLGQYKKFKQNE